MTYSTLTLNVARAWASIDGKLELFNAGLIATDLDGYTEGYITEAQELLKRSGIIKLLEEIDRKAQAGLCYASSGSRGAFLEEIRTIIKDQQ